MLFQLFCLCEWPGLFFIIICIHIFPDKESIRVSFFLTLKNTLLFKQTVQNTLSIWSGISALTETSLLPVLARMDTQCHRAHSLCLWAVQGYLGACSTWPTHSSGASRAQLLASHIHLEVSGLYGWQARIPGSSEPRHLQLLFRVLLRIQNSVIPAPQFLLPTTSETQSCSF